MKIYDCFMYFDEEVVLDVRLNTLNEFVDYFVIVESRFTHKGDARELRFNHKRFEKFKNKIIYLIYDKEPKEIEHKLRSYLHHREFDEQPLSVEEIDTIIKNKQAIYDLKVDKTVHKIGNGSKLEKFELSKLPDYIKINQKNLKEWID